MKQSFTRMFPAATGVKYEMGLKNNKEGFEVQFSPKGDILNTVSLKNEK